MIPWPGDEIIHVVVICLLENLIGFDRAIEIFLVPPTGDDEIRDLRLRRHDRRRDPRTPEDVIVRMLHEVAPGGFNGMSFDLATYYPIFLYLLFILAFAAGSLILAHRVGPHLARRSN